MISILCTMLGLVAAIAFMSLRHEIRDQRREDAARRAVEQLEAEERAAAEADRKDRELGRDLLRRAFESGPAPSTPRLSPEDEAANKETEAERRAVMDRMRAREGR